MKKDKICILAALWICLPLADILAQDTFVDLYLSPDIHSKKIETVSLNDPRLGSPSTVTDDAKAALGWQYASFSGTVEGFVQDSKIGKDMLPVNDSIIHAEPDADSAALAVYTFGNPIEIIDTGLWWKIQVESTFPVYFVADTLPPVPLMPDASAPAASTAVVGSATDIADDTTLFQPEATPEDGMGPPAYISQKQQESRRGVVARSYTGSLERSKSRIGIFKPKAPYQLMDDSGKRLLWVTFAETILPGTIYKYIGKDVIVHGESIRDEKSNDWILYVGTIREIR